MARKRRNTSANKGTIGIPTEYAGIRFRSRLEATWAAFFDLLGWKWDYEPFDLAGYIPDFTLPASPSEASGTTTQIVVDIKPIADWSSLARRGNEIMACGWRGPMFILGQAPMLREHHRRGLMFSIGHEVAYCSAVLNGKEYAMFEDVDEEIPIDIMRCGECSRIHYFARSSLHYCGYCGAESGYYDADKKKYHDTREPVDQGAIESLWATAKNRTQWRGAFDRAV